MFEKLIRKLFPDENLKEKIQQALENQFPDLCEQELTGVPEEIYLQITEIKQELPLE